MISKIKKILEDSKGVKELEAKSDSKSYLLAFAPHRMNLWNRGIEEIYSLIKSKIGNSAKVICDIGCGAGGLSILMALEGNAVFGCDTGEIIWLARFKRYLAGSSSGRDEFISSCEKYLPKSNYSWKDESSYINQIPISTSKLSKLNFLSGDISKLRNEKIFAEKMFDVCVCEAVIRHLDTAGYNSFFRDLSDITKKGGYIFIFDDKGTLDRFSRASGIAVDSQGRLSEELCYIITRKQ